MYKKILAPLDGSELSECTLEHVKAIATGCQVPEVVLLNVIEPNRLAYVEALQSNAPATAKMYAKAIAGMPGYFSSFIVGKEQLIELRAYVEAQLGSQYAPGLFHRWVGEAGPIPYTLLDREIQARVKKGVLYGVSTHHF